MGHKILHRKQKYKQWATKYYTETKKYKQSATQYYTKNNKYKPELISFEIQCFDSTFVDKLFKSVIKSWRFEKHASKCYFKITAINYISFCFR